MPFFLPSGQLYATATTTGAWLTLPTGTTGTLVVPGQIITWGGSSSTMGWANRQMMDALANATAQIGSGLPLPQFAAPAVLRGTQQRIDEQEQDYRRRVAGHEAVLDARKDATTRALNLLLEHLTPAQRETYRGGHIYVEGSRTKTRYRIRANGGIAGNVEVLDINGRTLHRLCAHCDHGLPWGDQILAQMMMLQFDEDSFLRIANRH